MNFQEAERIWRRSEKDYEEVAADSFEPGEGEEESGESEQVSWEEASFDESSEMNVIVGFR